MLKFRDEFDALVNGLRMTKLKDFKTMLRWCKDGAELQNGSCGFTADTQGYRYYLRCIPRRGDYNVYIYAYAKEAASDDAE